MDETLKLVVDLVLQAVEIECEFKSPVDEVKLAGPSYQFENWPHP